MIVMSAAAAVAAAAAAAAAAPNNWRFRFSEIRASPTKMKKLNRFWESDTLHTKRVSQLSQASSVSESLPPVVQ